MLLRCNTVVPSIIYSYFYSINRIILFKFQLIHHILCNNQRLFCTNHHIFFCFHMPQKIPRLSQIPRSRLAGIKKYPNWKSSHHKTTIPMGYFHFHSAALRPAVTAAPRRPARLPSSACLILTLKKLGII